jgi:hypothetical protein
MLAGWLYVAYFEGPGKLPSDLVFAVLGVLVGVWAVSFAGFLLTIKREYVGTFLSLETGCAYAVRFFNEADGDDERRIKIFNFAEALWSEIRGDVKDWTLDNYERWKAEKPPWFTVGLIKRLPDDFMPAADVAALDARAPGGKRKSLANMGLHKRFRSSLLTPAEDAADATLILPMPQAEDAAVSAGPAPEPHAPTASEAQPPDVPIESETQDGACHSLGRPLLLGSVAVAGPLRAVRQGAWSRVFAPRIQVCQIGVQVCLIGVQVCMIGSHGGAQSPTRAAWTVEAESSRSF